MRSLADGNGGEYVVDPANTPVELRSVDAGRGLAWLVGGWQLFVRAPVQWIVLAVLLLVAMAVCNALPVAGNLLAPFVYSVLAAMVLVAAHRARHAGSAELLNDALAGGSQVVLKPVVIVAAIQLGLSILVAIVGIIVMVGISGAGMVAATLRGDPGLLASGLAGLLPAVLVMLAGLAVVSAMYWFAIPDVVFGGAEPWTAMRRSLRACVANVLPLLVYGVFLMIGLAVSVMTFGLGLLVMLPVLFASWLNSYEDIYGVTLRMPVEPA